MSPRARLRDADGVTLVEILVAVSILGIAFVTLVGGMSTSIVASDVHRKEASAGAALRSYAETVKSATYTNCAPLSAYQPGAVGFSTPAGYVASATAVEYWVVDAADPNTGSFASTCSTDQGTQRISVQVASTDARATESIQIVKRKP